jgi:hypothetical protein
MKLLKLGLGNAKLGKTVVTFDLVAGWSCPFAKDCGDKVDPLTGKMIFNPKAKYRCFAATSELISSAARRKRWHNFNLVKSLHTAKDIADLIIASINSNAKTAASPLVRIHTSGDFFNQMYFNAWLIVAKRMPEKTFYAYTKSLKFWIANLNVIPANFHLTASLGGKTDSLIAKHNLKSVEVVYSVEEAEAKGLELDHDDSHAYNPACHKFGLLIHGTQKAGSRASKAISELHKKNIYGYQRGKVGAGRKEVAVA